MCAQSLRQLLSFPLHFRTFHFSFMLPSSSLFLIRQTHPSLHPSLPRPGSLARITRVVLTCSSLPLTPSILFLPPSLPPPPSISPFLTSGKVTTPPFYPSLPPFFLPSLLLPRPRGFHPHNPRRFRLLRPPLNRRRRHGRRGREGRRTTACPRVPPCRRRWFAH